MPSSSAERRSAERQVWREQRIVQSSGNRDRCWSGALESLAEMAAPDLDLPRDRTHRASILIAVAVSKPPPGH